MPSLDDLLDPKLHYSNDLQGAAGFGEPRGHPNKAQHLPHSTPHFFHLSLDLLFLHQYLHHPPHHSHQIPQQQALQNLHHLGVVSVQNMTHWELHGVQSLVHSTEH